MIPTRKVHVRTVAEAVAPDHAWRTRPDPEDPDTTIVESACVVLEGGTAELRWGHRRYVEDVEGAASGVVSTPEAAELAARRVPMDASVGAVGVDVPRYLSTGGGAYLPVGDAAYALREASGMSDPVTVVLTSEDGCPTDPAHVAVWVSPQEGARRPDPDWRAGLALGAVEIPHSDGRDEPEWTVALSRERDGTVSLVAEREGDPQLTMWLEVDDGVPRIIAFGAQDEVLASMSVCADTVVVSPGRYGGELDADRQTVVFDDGGTRFGGTRTSVVEGRTASGRPVWTPPGP